MLQRQAMKDFVEDPLGGGRIPIIPDGWGQLQISTGQRLSFCVEMDRGTQDIRPYKRKVRGYLHGYWESGAYVRRYETKSLTVLTVVSTGRGVERDHRRVKQLLTWTEAEWKWAKRPATSPSCSGFIRSARRRPRLS